VSVHSLVEASRSFRGRRGIRKLRTILASGPAPTRSELEDIVLDLILRAGLAHPSVNAPLTLGGRRVVPDFRWPEQRLVVEADGAVWHDNPTARADDAERQALLEAAGERVVRITWQQAIARPDETLARLRAAGAPPTAPGRTAPESFVG
jgi:very-short-patch-repair endonuclease